MRAGAERRRENDGRDVGEVRARADAGRLPHAGRSGGHGGVPRSPLPAGGQRSSSAAPGAFAGRPRGASVMQVAWRWTSQRLAEAPTPHCRASLTRLAIPVSGVVPGRVQGLGCKGSWG